MEDFANDHTVFSNIEFLDKGALHADRGLSDTGRLDREAGALGELVGCDFGSILGIGFGAIDHLRSGVFINEVDDELLVFEDIARGVLGDLWRLIPRSKGYDGRATAHDAKERERGKVGDPGVTDRRDPGDRSRDHEGGQDLITISGGGLGEV